MERRERLVNPKKIRGNESVVPLEDEKRPKLWKHFVEHAKKTSRNLTGNWRAKMTAKVDRSERVSIKDLSLYGDFEKIKQDWGNKGVSKGIEYLLAKIKSLRERREQGKEFETTPFAQFLLNDSTFDPTQIQLIAEKFHARPSSNSQEVNFQDVNSPAPVPVHQVSSVEATPPTAVEGMLPGSPRKKDKKKEKKIGNGKKSNSDSSALLSRCLDSEDMSPPNEQQRVNIDSSSSGSIVFPIPVVPSLEEVKAYTEKRKTQKQRKITPTKKGDSATAEQPPTPVKKKEKKRKVQFLESETGETGEGGDKGEKGEKGKKEKRGKLDKKNTLGKLKLDNDAEDEHRVSTTSSSKGIPESTTPSPSPSSKATTKAKPLGAHGGVVDNTHKGLGQIVFAEGGFQRKARPRVPWPPDMPPYEGQEVVVLTSPYSEV